MRTFRTGRYAVACGILALAEGGVPYSGSTLAAPRPPVGSAVPQPKAPRPAQPPAEKPTRLEGYGRLPLAFEPNRGQTAKFVRYLAHGPGYTAFLTATGVVLSFGTADLRTVAIPDGPAPRRPPEVRMGPVLSLRPLGANPHTTVTGLEKLPGTVNYFIGNDPRRWRTDVPTYARAEYRQIYPGINLRFDGLGGRLDYSWIVQPGGSAGRIRLLVTGAEQLSVDKRGSLIMRVGGWSLSQPRPTVYQSIGGAKRFISGRYLLRSNRVEIALGRYDVRAPLTIDPGLSYSTYLGGEGDQGLGIAVDGRGSAYVTGSVATRSFPTVGALQSRNHGQIDAFLAKLNPAGNALVYSTYLGGKDADEALAVAVDGSGNAYLTGDTYSADFPVVNAVQPENRSACVGPAGPARCNDAFVTKLNAAGDALVYSTYLGGNGGDAGNGIAVDGAGAAYVTGETDSSNFPTVNARQAHKKKAMCIDETSGVLASCGAAFVSKLNPSGSRLIYSTYLDGSGNDAGYDIAVDRAGNAYITGPTASSDFPTVHPVQRRLAGVRNAFVAKIDTTGAQVVYSTYLGGRLDTIGIKIAVDAAGSAYVTGWTRSPNFPTVNALQPRIGPGRCSCVDAFVTKLNPAGTALAYSSYLGGTADDEALSIAADSIGDVYLTGDTDSTDFPTANALQPHNAGQNDAFVTEIDRGGGRLNYSTYLGGKQDDYGHAIAVDRAGNAYVTGFTYSGDFPTRHALQGSAGGIFIAKIGSAPLPAAARGITCRRARGLSIGNCPRTNLSSLKSVEIRGQVGMTVVLKEPVNLGGRHPAD